MHQLLQKIGTWNISLWLTNPPWLSSIHIGSRVNTRFGYGTVTGGAIHIKIDGHEHIKGSLRDKIGPTVALYDFENGNASVVL